MLLISFSPKHYKQSKMTRNRTIKIKISLVVVFMFLMSTAVIECHVLFKSVRHKLIPSLKIKQSRRQTNSLASPLKIGFKDGRRHNFC